MNEQYFAEYILEETERIRKFQNKLKNNEVREDRIYSVKRKIDAIQFELLIARYITPIRPGRSKPRNMKGKKAISFMYRVA